MKIVDKLVTKSVVLSKEIQKKKTLRGLTERSPLIDEVSANFCEHKVSRGQRNESPRPLISVF
jgi:hypothetical protein